MVDCRGTVLETRQDNQGILNIENDAFAATLYPFIVGWRNEENDRPPVLMSGMIGSRQGWIEAPYVSSPASPADLAASVMAVPDTENVWIVPGVCLDPEGERRDVIRGEEVQVIGALDQTGRSSAVLCLPGTHSKWVHARDGYLLDFATAMTGEVFKVMCEYSILGTLMRHGADHDADAFASEKRMFENQEWAMAYVAPRGIGLTAWSGDARKQNHIRRRFYLLGQTLDGMRVLDLVRSAQALRTVDGFAKTPLWMQAHDHMAANLLYASLFTPKITRLDLHDVPPSHMKGPAYLGVMDHLDLKQAVALAVDRCRVVLYQPEAKYDPFPAQVAEALGLGKKAFSVRQPVRD